MGSFDGAEVCELVGLYFLSKLQHLDIYVGLGVGGRALYWYCISAVVVDLREVCIVL